MSDSNELKSADDLFFMTPDAIAEYASTLSESDLQSVMADVSSHLTDEDVEDRNQYRGVLIFLRQGDDRRKNS